MSTYEERQTLRDMAASLKSVSTRLDTLGATDSASWTMIRETMFAQTLGQQYDPRTETCDACGQLWVYVESGQGQHDLLTVRRHLGGHAAEMARGEIPRLNSGQPWNPLRLTQRILEDLVSEPPLRAKGSEG